MMENNIQNQEIINKPKNDTDEIDLAKIVLKLWRNRRFIIKVTAIFAILGLIIAISAPNVYTASCTMVPQTGEKKAGGSLGGLAAIAGINLGNLSSGEVLSPSLYPRIMTNINFQKELIYSKFHFKGIEQPLSLYDYYSNSKYQKFNLVDALKKYTIGLPNIIISIPSKIFGTIKKKTDDITQSDSTLIQSLTINEKQVFRIINGNLSLNINDKEGFITLSSNMPDPIAAAELVQIGVELLQKYITEFKIGKVTKNLMFVEKSYEEAKVNFELKQEELAKFRDANKNLTSAMAKTQEEKLTSEYNLLLGIYSELAKQKEQAKIAVTETTPILTVIEPVVIPIERSKPNRPMLLFIYTFLGIIVGVGIVFIFTYLEATLIPNIKNYRFSPRIQ